MSSEEPKLIIDEDWKTQVQREKEELKQKLASEESEPAPTEENKTAENTAAEASTAEATSAADLAQPPPAPESEEEDEDTSGPLPPASISVLITTLATQAMAAMGLMPDAQGEPMPVKLDFARHFIDMLSTLEDKTRGNLSEDEKTLFTDALHQLRMAFVAVSKRV